MMMHMHMTFYWGTNITLLFDSLHIQTLPAYALAISSCFLFAALYQFLEDRRIKLKLLAAGRRISQPQVEIPILYRKMDSYSRWSLVRLTESLLFGVDSAIAYLLMLAVMSFNGGVFFSVVLGLFFGYLFFRSGGGDLLLVVDDTCACA